MNMYLVEVDDGLPEVALLLVEVPHTDLSEVTGMVLFSHVSPCPSVPGFVQDFVPCPCWYGGGADHQRDPYHLRIVRIYSIIVFDASVLGECLRLTGMLAVLSDTALAGGDVAAAAIAESALMRFQEYIAGVISRGRCGWDRTYCLRVLEVRVGMATADGVCRFGA